MCIDILTRAFRGVYPFQSETMGAFVLFGRDKKFSSPKEVVDLVEAEISALEKRLDNYDLRNQTDG